MKLIIFTFLTFSLCPGVTVIQEQITKKTPVGKQLQETLLTGGTISEDTILELIKSKILSPEVEHRGYVLDDIPSSTNRGSMSSVEQLQFFKSLGISPQFIVYIRVCCYSTNYINNFNILPR